MCANPVLIVGRRASRQGSIPLSPLNLHLDPPPGSRSLPLGFRARKMFTGKISSASILLNQIHGSQAVQDEGEKWAALDGSLAVLPSYFQQVHDGSPLRSRYSLCAQETLNSYANFGRINIAKT